ncbi:DUF3592 domain-containing protein [Lutibacter sp. A80]|uniref:DUF3592 domain-containing protein n=1 Tax=Lutibacter sp. A80 TaxID=2918453 RepID=UPI001F06D5CE|nr:DUF3592 domain-containing protein [Lutibacter sp. A80]UMB59825.1 DUF3592 domain-containing protein [Lutibacter sp. A80]
MKSQIKSPFTTFIMGIIFIGISWFVYNQFSAPMVEEAEASKNWPTTLGVITFSDISQHTNNDGNNMYASTINYNYTVANKSYVGDRISLSSSGASTSSIREVKETLKTYPVDTQVNVYYDPEFPNNAVLEPGADFLTYLVKYIPWLFGFFGILMMWQLVKKALVLIIALLISSKN